MNNELCGIILKGVGGLFEVRPFSEVKNSVFCRARGVFRHENRSPFPGDHVRLVREKEGSDTWVIEEIMPRRNCMIRPAMANVTHLVLVLPAARPEPDLRTMDKLISISEYLSIEPMIVINKCDLDPARAEEIREVYETSGFSVFKTTAKEGAGLTEVRLWLSALAREREETIVALAGASGVGKSTLIGQLFPDRETETGDVSRKTEHGRHTTREVSLIPSDEPGFYVADTPGFSMIDFTRFNFYPSAALPDTFREFARVAVPCRYTKCTHTKEEGCAILAAVKNGEIPQSRHDSYVALWEEFRAKPDWKRKKEGILSDDERNER